MKTNKFLFFLCRKFPTFYDFHFRDRAHIRAARIAYKKLCKVINEQMNECWGWDIDREKYDALLAIKIRYGDMIEKMENVQ